MMRLAAGLALVVALTAGAAEAAVGLPVANLAAPGAAPAVQRIEYYCSPGFVPSYGGTCLAVPPRTEVELFVDQPLYGTEVVRRVVRHVRRHRHGLREMY